MMNRTPRTMPRRGATTMKMIVLIQPWADDRPRPRLDDGRPGVAADEGVGGARGQSQVPGEEVPADGPDEPGEDDLRGHDRDVDHPRADGVGHARAEDEEGDEIEEGGPDDGLTRRQDPGRDDRGDGVGRVVHAVGEVEGQRDQDDEDDEEEAGVGHETQVALTMISSMTLATSSQRSAATSSRV